MGWRGFEPREQRAGRVGEEASRGEAGDALGGDSEGGVQVRVCREEEFPGRVLPPMHWKVSEAGVQGAFRSQVWPLVSLPGVMMFLCHLATWAPRLLLRAPHVLSSRADMWAGYSGHPLPNLFLQSPLGSSFSPSPFRGKGDCDSGFSQSKCCLINRGWNPALGRWGWMALGGQSKEPPPAS